MKTPQPGATGRLQDRFTPEFFALLVVSAAYIGWILSLPLFPTQDGPVHLYYVHVMQALFSKQPTPYSSFYYIKHLLPPYSLYYYSLIALANFVPTLLADKLIICCYVLSFVFGFRYLAQTIGPGADRMTLLATLILLNWPLGMGFVNFCLSISFGLWAIGTWVRFTGRPGYGRRAVFVPLTIVITMTHPVPLLFVLAFCGLSLLLRLLQKRSPSTGGLPAYFVQDGAAFLLAGLTLGYVKLFTSAKILHQTLQADSAVAAFVHHPHPLGFFYGETPRIKVYAGLLIAVLCLALLLACLSWWTGRSRAARPPVLWLVLAIGFLALLPFIPHDLNGSHFFSDRLTIFGWLLALLAASAYQPRWKFERYGLIVLALLCNGFILSLAEGIVRPFANNIAMMQNAAKAHRGEVGLALEDRNPTLHPPQELGYDAYLWAPVHYFRANDAILYNTPWLDLEIIPLGAKASLAESPLSSTALEAPWTLAPELRDSPREWAEVLSKVRFAVVDAGRVEVTDTPPPSLKDDPVPAHHWSCTARQASWYEICDRGSPAP